MQNKGPLVCTTENYLKHFLPIAMPGKKDYASSTKNGRKVFAVGDSHTNLKKRFQ